MAEPRAEKTPSAAPTAGRGRMPQKIREAARTLFLAKGYEATSMDAVAAAAPCSKRTLYQHFPSKAELFAAVVAKAWDEFVSVPHLPMDAPGDPRAVLTAYTAHLMAHWDRPHVIPLLRLIIAEAPRFPELSAAYFKAGKEPAVRGLAAYFQLLKKDGLLAEGLEPQLAAAQFMGAVKEPLFWPRVLGVPVSFPTDAAVERAIAGVLRPARGSAS